MRLFTQHKSGQVGHRSLQVRLKGGLRPQGSPQNFQVAVDVIQRGSGGGGLFRQTIMAFHGESK